MNREHPKALIKLAKDEFFRVFHDRITTQKSITAYAKFLVQNARLKFSSDEKLRSFSEAEFSKAIKGTDSITEKRVLEIWDTLQAILLQYGGLEFDKTLNKFVEVEMGSTEALPVIEGKAEVIESNLELIRNFPKSKINEGFKSGKRIKILQTIIPDNHEFARNIDTAIKNNCDQIQILLVQPYSSASHLRAHAIGHSPGTNFDELILGTLNVLSKKFNKNELMGKVEVKLYEYPPVISIFSFENSAKKIDLYYGAFWYKTTTIDGPWLRIKEHSVLSYSVLSHFDKLWNESSMVPLEENNFQRFKKDLELAYLTFPFSFEYAFLNPQIKLKGFFLRENNICCIGVSLNLLHRSVEIHDIEKGDTYRGVIVEVAGTRLQLIVYSTLEKPQSIELIIYSDTQQLNQKQFQFGVFKDLNTQNRFPELFFMVLEKLDENANWQDLPLSNPKLENLLRSQQPGFQIDFKQLFKKAFEIENSDNRTNQ